MYDDNDVKRLVVLPPGTPQSTTQVASTGSHRAASELTLLSRWGQMYNICDNSLVTLNINNINNNNSKTLCEGGCAIKPSSQHGAGFAKATLLLRGKEAIPGREAQKEVGAGDHDDHVLVMVPMI